MASRTHNSSWMGLVFVIIKLLRFAAWPALVGLLLAVLLLQLYPGRFGLPERSTGHSWRGADGPYSYAAAVDRAAPSVVNLYAAKRVKKGGNGLLDDPLFRRFFGDNLPDQRRIESSLGSAIIMSDKGYLLTNEHVIDGAERIVVALRDGREAAARLVGSDPETDLAVLKIELPNLPAISVGPSDDTRTGDVVLAIGNPFGVGQTVTQGIVSATGRNQLGLNTYEDFIQTDAAINPGNSGGALVDAKGRLIGVNTAIFSRSGGSQGIGFAIPSELAEQIMQAIIRHGQVIRGWVGVEVQPLSPALAESLNIHDASGVLISGVYRNGPADRAGLQPGDLILSVDGQTASDGHRTMNQVAQTEPGKKVMVRLLRAGKALSTELTVGQRPPQEKERR